MSAACVKQPIRRQGYSRMPDCPGCPDIWNSSFLCSHCEEDDYVIFKTLVYPRWPIISLGQYQSIEDVPISFWDEKHTRTIRACARSSQQLDNADIWRRDAFEELKDEVYDASNKQNPELIPLWLLLAVAYRVGGDNYQAHHILSSVCSYWTICRYGYQERPNDHLLYAFWATYSLDKIIALEMALLPMLPYANTRLPFPNSEESAGKCRTAWPSQAAVDHKLVTNIAVSSTITHHFQALDQLARLARIIEEAIYLAWHDHRRTTEEKKRLGQSMTKWVKNLPPGLKLDTRALEQTVLLPEVAHLHLLYNTLVIFVRAEMNYFQPPQMTDILLSERSRQAAANIPIIIGHVRSMISASPYRLEWSYTAALSSILVSGLLMLHGTSEAHYETTRLYGILDQALHETDFFEDRQLQDIWPNRAEILGIISNLLNSVNEFWQACIADPLTTYAAFECECATVLPEPDDRALADPLRRLIAFTCAHLHKRDPAIRPLHPAEGKKRKSDIGLAADEEDEEERPIRKSRIGTKDVDNDGDGEQDEKLEGLIHAKDSSLAGAEVGNHSDDSDDDNDSDGGVEKRMTGPASAPFMDGKAGTAMDGNEKGLV